MDMMLLSTSSTSHSTQDTTPTDTSHTITHKDTLMLLMRRLLRIPRKRMRKSKKLPRPCTELSSMATAMSMLRIQMTSQRLQSHPCMLAHIMMQLIMVPITILTLLTIYMEYMMCMAFMRFTIPMIPTIYMTDMNLAASGKPITTEESMRTATDVDMQTCTHIITEAITAITMMTMMKMIMTLTIHIHITRFTTTLSQLWFTHMRTFTMMLNTTSTMTPTQS